MEKEKAGSILESIRNSELIPAHVELTEEAILSSWDDLSHFQENLEGVDALLELTENLRPVPIRLYLRLGDFGLPLVLFGGEFYATPRRFEATGYWRHRGVAVYLPLTRTELKEQLTLLAAKHRIRQTRALLVGSRYNSTFVVTTDYDFSAALRALGVEIQSCGTEKFMSLFKAAEESRVSLLAQEWLREAEQVVEPTEKDLHRSARYYLVMKDVLKEYRAGAMAINCLPLVEEIQGTPCMALVRLNDEGIPAACEGDLTALMTMIFMERLANRPTFQGNIIYANPTENVIEINHCVLPFFMGGYDQPKKPYVLRDYHGRGMGVCAAYEPELGRTVTLARFSTDFRDMVFLTGRLVGFGEDYCRSNLRVKVPDVKSFIKEVRGNHHILVYGDHSDGISALCESFGICPVSVGSL
jgi:L-fucose isomerase-like protein